MLRVYEFVGELIKTHPWLVTTLLVFPFEVRNRMLSLF